MANQYPAYPEPGAFNPRVAGASGIPTGGGLYADTTAPAKRSLAAFSNLMSAGGKFIDHRNKKQIEEDLLYLTAEQEKLNKSLLQAHKDGELPLTPQQQAIGHQLDQQLRRKNLNAEVVRLIDTIDTDPLHPLLKEKSNPKLGELAWGHVYSDAVMEDLPPMGEGGLYAERGFYMGLSDDRLKLASEGNRVGATNRLKDTKNAFLNNVVALSQSMETDLIGLSGDPTQVEYFINDYIERFQDLLDTGHEGQLLDPQLLEAAYTAWMYPAQDEELDTDTDPDSWGNVFEAIMAGTDKASATAAGLNAISKASPGVKQNKDRQLAVRTFENRREFWQTITRIGDPTDIAVYQSQEARLYELLEAGIFSDDELFGMFKTADIAVIRGEHKLRDFVQEQVNDAIVVETVSAIETAAAVNHVDGSPHGDVSTMVIDMVENAEDVGVDLPSNTHAEVLRNYRIDQRKTLDQMLIAVAGGDPDLSDINQGFLEIFKNPDGSNKTISADDVTRFMSLGLKDPDVNTQIRDRLRHAFSKANDAYVKEGGDFEGWFYGTTEGTLMRSFAKLATDPVASGLLWGIAGQDDPAVKFFRSYANEVKGDAGALPPSQGLMEQFRLIHTASQQSDAMNFSDIVPKGFNSDPWMWESSSEDYMSFLEDFMDQVGDNMGASRGAWPGGDEAQESGIFYGSGSLFYFNATGDLDFDNLPYPQQQALLSWVHDGINLLNPTPGTSAGDRDTLMQGLLSMWRQDVERTGKRPDRAAGGITMISGENIQYDWGGFKPGWTFGGVFQMGNQGVDHKGVPIRIMSLSDDVFTRNIAKEDNDRQRRFAEFAPRMFSGYTGEQHELMISTYNDYLESTSTDLHGMSYADLLKDDNQEQLFDVQNKARRQLQEEMPNIWGSVTYEPTDLAQTRRLFRGRQHPQEVHPMLSEHMHTEEHWPQLPPQFHGPDGVDWDKVSIIGDKAGVYHLVDESQRSDTEAYGRVIPGFQFTADDINTAYEWWKKTDDRNRELWTREEAFAKDHNYSMLEYEVGVVVPTKGALKNDKNHGVTRTGRFDASNNWVGAQPYNIIKRPDGSTGFDFWGTRTVGGIDYVLDRPLAGHVRMQPGWDGFTELENVDDFMHTDPTAPHMLFELGAADNMSLYGQGGYRFFHNSDTGRLSFVREGTDQDTPKTRRDQAHHIRTFESRPNITSLNAQDVRTMYSTMGIDSDKQYITQSFNNPLQDAARDEQISKRRAEAPERTVYRNNTKEMLQLYASSLHPGDDIAAAEVYFRLEKFIPDMEARVYVENDYDFPDAVQVDDLADWGHVEAALIELGAIDAP